MIVITTYLVIDKKETAVNIRQLMKVNNVTPKELQHYLGFSCIQSIYRKRQTEKGLQVSKPGI